MKRKDPKEIRQYYFDLSKGKEEINRIKLLLIGDEYQGKTTLLYFLRTGNPPREEIKRTDSIDIHIWEPKKGIQISAWDFAGQKVRMKKHHFIFKKRVFKYI